MSYIYPANHTTGRAMFVWNKDSVDSTQEQADLVAFCQTNKINCVLLSIYNWIGRYVWSTANVDGLKALVSALKTAGIAVYAVAGNDDWTVLQNWVRRTVIEPLRQYQAQCESKEQFDGFVFDVEWFISDNDPQKHVPLMCDLMKDTKEILNMPVGLWAPWWQITEDRSTGLVSYDGFLEPEGVHWMHVSDMVFVGAYSNIAESVSGQQGQISMLENWLSYVSTSGRRIPIWCTSETKQLSWQSYYGMTKSYMETQHALIASAFLNEGSEGSTCFYGQCVHHYDTYKVMGG